MKCLFFFLVFVVVASPHFSSAAGQTESNPSTSPSLENRIAIFLWHDSPNDKKALKGLRRGLRLLELDEAASVFDANRDEEKARAFLRRAERDRARCVVSLGTRATLIAKEELKSLPLIFSAVTNPVLSKIVPSWEGGEARLCGNSNWLDRKAMLGAFRAAVPDMKTLGVLYTRGNAVSEAEIEEAGRALGDDVDLKLRSFAVDEPEVLERRLDEALKVCDALWIPIDFALYQEKTFAKIAARARAAGVPIVSSSERCAGRGALLVLAVDYELLGLRAAALFKRVVLKKMDPSKIPVGRLVSSRLYVDLGVARTLSRRLPRAVVLNAWKVFEAKKP